MMSVSFIRCLINTAACIYRFMNPVIDDADSVEALRSGNFLFIYLFTQHVPYGYGIKYFAEKYILLLLRS